MTELHFRRFATFAGRTASLPRYAIVSTAQLPRDLGALKLMRPETEQGASGEIEARMT
jgi:hypothetical protein